MAQGDGVPLALLKGDQDIEEEGVEVALAVPLVLCEGDSTPLGVTV